MSRWRMPDFLALLADLDRLGIHVRADDDGRLVLDGPAGIISDDLAANVRAHRQLLAVTVAARRTGHVWCSCTGCGQPVLLNPGSHGGSGHVWPTCRLTPGCTGRHQEPT
jgi:hypothetical protein